MKSIQQNFLVLIGCIVVVIQINPLDDLDDKDVLDLLLLCSE